jgi:hypothetical protein
MTLPFPGALSSGKERIVQCPHRRDGKPFCDAAPEIRAAAEQTQNDRPRGLRKRASRNPGATERRIGRWLGRYTGA